MPRSARSGLEPPVACISEGNRVMSRIIGSGPVRMRLAFYGRTNQTGEKAGTDVPRQFRACSAIAAERGLYDAPHSFNVRDVEFRLGAPHIDAIICAVLDRLPRPPRLRHPLPHAASTADAPLVPADDDLSQTQPLASSAVVFFRLGLSCPDWPPLR